MCSTDDLLINRYRNQLMGVATLGVLLVHSIDIVHWNSIIENIVGYGGVGVYIFVYLSAIGLFISLKTRGVGYKKFDFYKRRFQRVLVPYLLIAGSWYGVKYLVFQHDILGFLYELSTLSFWIDHQGAWYVAMLIPVYLIFPYFFDWVEGNSRKCKFTRQIKIISISTIVFIAVFVISIFNPLLYNHLSQVFSSIIVYLLGYYVADKVICKQYNGYLISSVSIIFFIIKSITPLKWFDAIHSISWSLLAIPVLTVSALILSKMKSKVIDSFLGFFGKYSLEIYLWNIFLIQIIEYFGIKEWIEKRGDNSGYRIV